MKRFLILSVIFILSAAKPISVVAQQGCCLTRSPRPEVGIIGCTTVSSRSDCSSLFSTFTEGKICDTKPVSLQCIAKPEAEEKKIQWQPVQPNLQINIPNFQGFTKLQPKGVEEADGTYVYVPFIGQYLAAIYRYAVAVVGVIAAIFIIKGGFDYLTSAGNATKIEQAKETIGNAIIGLILVLGSYVVFYTIDPELLQFKHLKVKVIENVAIEWDINAESEVASPEIINQVEQKPGGFSLLTDLNDTFGTKAGECAKWVNFKLAEICGPQAALAIAKGNAWDIAVKYLKQGDGKRDTLDGIQDGALVFMTSVGGTGFAPDEVEYPNGASGMVTRVTKSSKTPQTIGLPPVTHIGIYYQGKIYNQYFGPKISAFDINTKQNKELPIHLKGNKDGPLIKGLFVKIPRDKLNALESKNWEYIAGYANPGTYPPCPTK